MDTYQNVNNHIIIFLKKNANSNTLRKWKEKQNEFKLVFTPGDITHRDITTYQEVMDKWDGEYIFTDIFWENSMLMSPPKSYIDIEPPLQAKRLDEDPDNTIILYKNMFNA